MAILEPYSLNDVKEACRRYVTTPGVEFLPKPGQLLAIIDDIVAERRQGATLAELKELERRRASGEKFYGMADVAKLMKEKMPDIDISKVIEAGKKP